MDFPPSSKNTKDLTNVNVRVSTNRNVHFGDVTGKLVCHLQYHSAFWFNHWRTNKSFISSWNGSEYAQDTKLLQSGIRQTKWNPFHPILKLNYLVIQFSGSRNTRLIPPFRSFETRIVSKTDYEETPLSLSLSRDLSVSNPLTINCRICFHFFTCSWTFQRKIWNPSNVERAKAPNLQLYKGYIDLVPIVFHRHLE